MLPQFNGVLESYWGRNFFKLHTEYLGAVVVVLAALGVGDRSRTRLVRALGVIALLFLLVALGGHTPFYRLWYEVMPMMKKVRAPGMAFYLVAFRCAVFAGFGADRLLRREVSLRALAIPLAVLGGLGLLGPSVCSRAWRRSVVLRRAGARSWRPTRSELQLGALPPAAGGRAAAAA